MKTRSIRIRKKLPVEIILSAIGKFQLQERFIGEDSMGAYDITHNHTSEDAEKEVDEYTKGDAYKEVKIIERSRWQLVVNGETDEELLRIYDL